MVFKQNDYGAEMKVDLLQHTPNPEVFIGQMAGICYGKSDSDDATCIKRAAHCVDSGHLSTLRFAHAVFRIEGISRVCSTQLLRSKHLDFLQRSQRYCNESQTQTVRPVMDAMQVTIFEQAEIVAFDAYDALIESGMKKEDARMILPIATETELIVVGNFQAWLDFLRLRATKEAQWEIRELAYEIQKQLHGIAPNVFKTSESSNT